MTMLSNSLTAAADHLAEVRLEFEAASATAHHHALLMGGLLLDAKDQSEHGAWLPFLARAGIHERRAQRLMSLARLGIEYDTVSLLGGLTAALRFFDDIRLPAPGEALAVYAGHDETDGKAVLIYPAADPAFLFVDGYDLATAESWECRRPMRSDVLREASGIRVSIIWHTVRRLMGDRLAEAAAALVSTEDILGWRESDAVRVSP